MIGLVTKENFWGLLADPGLPKRSMSNAEREPITGVWGVPRILSRVQGVSTL